MRISKATREQAAEILSACACGSFSPDGLFIGTLDAEINFDLADGLNTESDAGRLARAAYYADENAVCDARWRAYAEGEAMLRTGWRPK